MPHCIFYSHLLLEKPCAALDVSIQMLAQRDKLEAARVPWVSKRRRARLRGAPPQQLGRDHRRFSVVPERYNNGWGKPAGHLEAVPRAWTPHLAATWRQAYGFIAKVVGRRY